jgi:hypothetical protein
MERILHRGRVVALACAFALAGAFPQPARAADPLLMLLLGIARDMVISHARQSGARAPAPEVDFARFYPGTLVEPALVRRLIDDCFGYLSGSQRQEIFDAFNAALLDPRNAAVRAPMIEYFADRALAMRAAHRLMNDMSAREKASLVADFRAEAAAMTREDQTAMGEALRQGLLPVPADLGQMLLAALER